MYSLKGIGGTESSIFWSYWENVKGKINSIYALGPKYKQLRSKFVALKNRAAKIGSPVSRQIASKTNTIDQKLIKWKSIKAKMDSWVPTFKEIDKGSKTDTTNISGIGFLPLVLPAWATVKLLAGGMVALTGIYLYAKYAFNEYGMLEQAYEDLRDKVITEEQYKTVVTSVKASPIATAVGAGMGKVLGLGILFGGGFLALKAAKKI